MKNWARRSIAIALLCAGPYAGADAGWVALLKNTPAEKFQDDDIRMFLETARQVLEAPGPAETVSWANPETGAGGRFKVLGESVAKDGAPCKRLRFGVYASKAPEKSGTWTACKAADGRWKLVTAG
jgi:surface antigen